MVPATREPLNRRRILEAALRLIDAEGLAGLSMRRLGQQLGVEAMSLYHHVPGKAALLGGVVEVLLGEIEIPSPDAGDWTDRARALARSYRRLAHRHREAFPLLVTRELKTPAAHRLIDGMVDICRGAGYGEAAALDAFTTVSGYATGYALFEIGGFFAFMADATTNASSPASGSRLHPTNPTLFAHGDAQFEFGLDAVLVGLEAKLRPDGMRRSRTADTALGASR